MARPHHRKKHKEHLRQYQQSREPLSPKIKSKATRVFAIVGAVIGLAVTYFISQGASGWMIMLAGVLAGAGLGFLFGKSIESLSGN
jgi:NAD/NADP transhydrogenase beta subunit